MNHPITIILSLFLLLPVSGQSLKDWQKLQTVDDICRVYPDHMETMLQQFNLGSSGLEDVKAAFERKELPQACRLLLEYYQKGETAKYYRFAKPPISQVTDPQVDLIVGCTFTFYTQKAVVPHKADGHIDWAFRGPANDIEWAWALNRHHYLNILLEAYRTTGNPVYAQTIDLHVKDWVISSLPYPAKKSNTEMWRGLEVCARAKAWAKTFYGLIGSGYLSPATQLLMLSSLPEHAHYMRNYHQEGNWLTMEMTGLATVATAWPELKESSQWFTYAVGAMTESLKEQVYPDGVQTELTSHYHHVALNNFSQLITICDQANQPLPDFYKTSMESMWNYLAYTMRPDGCGLMNNDSDQNNNREAVEEAAGQYRRDDWKYIATNGREGTRPKGNPSLLFPWAGQVITRSGYDADAQWAFFDIGPWGSGHQHNDKMNLTVVANGREFLVDGGRFAYRGEVADKFRSYALGSASHNVILIDGEGQSPGPKEVKEPLTAKNCTITDRFDCAWGSFDQFTNLEGNATHSRTLFYVRGAFWVVVDRVATDRPRKIEALWHWHPECQVSLDDQIVTARNGQAYLQVIPVGKAKWTVDMVKGREEPSIQGWYSKAYNEFEPNTASIYTTNIQKEATFVWILFPSGKPASGMKAKIVSENKDGLVLQVKESGGQWDMNIPFMDSNKASMTQK